MAMEQKELKTDGNYFQITEYIQRNQIHRAMVVCDGSLEHLEIRNYFQRIENKTEVSLIYFSDFTPNPLYESVVCGVEQFRSHHCELIIAVGGGSAIDVAKCIKLYSNMDPEKNYLGQEIIPNNVKLLAIPTTAGTGSEATKFAVIYYDGEKQTISHESCVPDAYMLDSSTLKSLPDYQKKSAALDALCHGIESFWSVNSTEESRSYSREAIEMIHANLTGYLAGKRKCASQMLYAAHLAGKAINIAQTTAGHAMCYKLTSLYGITHGHAAALCVTKLWPFMIENIDRCIDPRGQEYLSKILLQIAKAMGCASTEEGLRQFQEMFHHMELSVPKYSESDIGILCRSVNPVRLKNNPIYLTDGMIEKLYRQILREEDL